MILFIFFIVYFLHPHLTAVGSAKITFDWQINADISVDA